MKNKQIKELRMNIGKFLHEYYIQFGEKKYNDFVNKMGLVLSSQYGDSFSRDNLRIMEVEYITFNSVINEKKATRVSTKKNTTKR